MNILFRRFRENRGATAAAGLILAIAVIGVLAPVLPLSCPTEISLTEKLLSPSLTHLLGTDSLGRDLLSRLIWGIRSTLFTGAAAMLITCLAGAAYGAVSVILGGRAESLMMRAADIFMSFPSAVLVLAIVGIAGPGLGNILFACAAAKWPWYARMMRTILRSIMQSGYVQYARAAGASRFHILFSHLLPGAARGIFRPDDD